MKILFLTLLISSSTFALVPGDKAGNQRGVIEQILKKATPKDIQDCNFEIELHRVCEYVQSFPIDSEGQDASLWIDQGIRRCCEL